MVVVVVVVIVDDNGGRRVYRNRFYGPSQSAGRYLYVVGCIFLLREGALNGLIIELGLLHQVYFGTFIKLGVIGVSLLSCLWHVASSASGILGNVYQFRFYGLFSWLVYRVKYLLREMDLSRWK